MGMNGALIYARILRGCAFKILTAPWAFGDAIYELGVKARFEEVRT
jgi:hypothetical protein